MSATRNKRYGVIFSLDAAHGRMSLNDFSRLDARSGPESRELLRSECNCDDEDALG